MARFKNRLCLASLPLPGYNPHARECACLRHADHEGPHRAQGKLEWQGYNPRYFVDRSTGKLIPT